MEWHAFLDFPPANLTLSSQQASIYRLTPATLENNVAMIVFLPFPVSFIVNQILHSCLWILVAINSTLRLCSHSCLPHSILCPHPQPHSHSQNFKPHHTHLNLTMVITLLILLEYNIPWHWTHWMTWAYSCKESRKQNSLNFCWRRHGKMKRERDGQRN